MNLTPKKYDEILIEGLELPVRIGVPDEERSALQVLKADIRLQLEVRFDRMQDDLKETLDYAQLAEQTKSLAAARPRQLLETLVSELVAQILEHQKVAAVEITLRKRILPGTDFVAVRMHREKARHT